MKLLTTGLERRSPLRLVRAGWRGMRATRALALAGLAALAANSLAVAGGTSTNRVLVLDGKSGCLEVADSAAMHSLSNAMTIELWFKARSFAKVAGGVSCLLRKNVVAGSENFFLRFRTTDEGQLVEFSPGHGNGVARAPFRFQPERWYHLAATYDGAEARVLVNGAVVGSAALSGAIPIDSSPLLVGRGDPDYSGGEYFDGALDEMRIWNQARSQSEIQAAAITPLVGTEAALVAYWNFEESDARDVSGHANGGALKGGARIEASARPAVLEPATEAEPAVKRPALSTDQRLEVLEDLWRQLSEVYPALEYKGISGREWIEPTAQRVRQARSDEEFYELLLELLASLKDTHTRIVSYPGQPILALPPVVLNQMEGKVAVIRADASTGLKPGDVLVSVDDKPAADCLAAQMKRVCGSTDLGRVRGACWQLLAGRPGTTVALKVQGADQTVRQVTLRRESNAGFLNEPAVSWRSLGDSLGYIRISQWGGGNLVAEIDKALEEFKGFKGLVIDVRGNGGGSDELADEVNGRLIEKPVISSIDFWRQAGTNQFRKTIGWVQPRGPWTYQGRVAVLIDEGCASACEHFVSGIEAMGRVLLVGRPTNGAGGGPTGVTLSDGTRVVISRALGLRANGVVFEGLGIPPHILLSPTLDDLRQGRDVVLDAAKRWILSGKPVPARSQSLLAPAL